MTVQATIAEIEHADYVVGDFKYYTGGTWTGGYLRAGIDVNSGDGNSWMGRKFAGGAKTTVSVCCKQNGSDAAVDRMFLGLADGNVPILGLRAHNKVGSGVGGTYDLQLASWNGAAWVALATSSIKVNTASVRFDMFVENYGAAARVRVWVRYFNGGANVLTYNGPAELVIDFTGDVTAAGHASADGLFVRNIYQYADFGAVIAADEQTALMELIGMGPNGAGDVDTMDLGTYADIDEVTANTTDYVQSGTDGQEILVNAVDPPVATLAVLAVDLCADLAKGTSGPNASSLGVKTGGTENWDALQAAPIAPGNRQRLMTTNPVTGNPWTVAEVTALQYGIKSGTI